MSARRRAPFLAVLIVLAATAALRARLLSIPLERDEGEYAYAGQLLLKGVAPYLEMHSMKLPGIYACYALVLAVFGQTTTGIHLGLLAANALAILLVFFLARTLAGSVAGVSAAAFYAVLSVSPAVQGTQANAEHFVLLPVLAAALVLWSRREAQELVPLLRAGALLGFGFLIKQQSAAFLPWGGLWLLATAGGRARSLRALAAFAGGALLPYASVCLVYLALGRFAEFWFWTVTYAGRYVSMQSLADGLAELEARLAAIGRAAWPIVLLAAFGLVALLVRDPGHAAPAERRPARLAGGFLATFTLFSASAVCPGFYFRPHYFVLVLPALAIAAGAGVASLASFGRAGRRGDAGPPEGGSWKREAAVMTASALAVAALTHALVRDRKFFFRMTPLQAARKLYSSEPFPEAVEVGRFLEANTRHDEPVAVIGSEPEIYFYARRRAATAFIYMYPLAEPQPDASAMQRELIAEVEAARPRFLVWVKTPFSWGLRPGSDRSILHWLKAYARANYRIVGRVDLDGSIPPRFEWGPQAEWGTGSQIVVFARLAP